MSIENKLIRGRPHGGISIMWRKTISHGVKIIQYDDDRILGIELKTSGFIILILCVYMPYECNDNYDDFCFYLDKVKCITESANTPYVFAVGDFNADIKSNSVFGSELIEFCNMNDLCFIDKAMLLSDTFTYVSQSHHTTSWLDHCITTGAGKSIVSKMHIIDNIVCSDHMPLCIEIECDIVPICNSTFIKEPRDVCKWNLAGDKEKLSYKTCTNELFSDIIIPVDALLCNNAHCIEHVTDIDNFYTCIINGIQSAEKKCIPFESIAKNYHTVPGWNEYVKDNHAVARDAFWLWNLYGRPNQGQLYHSMRSSRAHFKYALKFAKRIEDTAKADALAKDLGGQKHDDFWKSVSKINQNSQLHATTIDGINGEANIANYWRNHFHGILNSNVCDQALKNSILGTLDDIQHDARMTVCYTDVQTLIHKLEFGKSAGPDGICAEALKCAHDQLSVLLSLCFTLFLSHGYLPPKLIETTIVPIIKNKCGNISSSSNYRPIALATIISKLLESILLLNVKNIYAQARISLDSKKRTELNYVYIP